MIRLYAAIAAASLAMSGASFYVGKWRGYDAGVSHEQAVQSANRAQTQQALDRLGEKVAQQAGALLALQRERESLVQSLEDDARAAPGAQRDGVGAGGLQRLEQRWGQP